MIRNVSNIAGELVYLNIRTFAKSVMSESPNRAEIRPNVGAVSLMVQWWKFELLYDSIKGRSQFKRIRIAVGSAPRKLESLDLNVDADMFSGKATITNSSHHKCGSESTISWRISLPLLLNSFGFLGFSCFYHLLVSAPNIATKSNMTVITISRANTSDDCVRRWWRSSHPSWHQVKQLQSLSHTRPIIASHSHICTLHCHQHAHAHRSMFRIMEVHRMRTRLLLDLKRWQRQHTQTIWSTNWLGRK